MEQERKLNPITIKSFTNIEQSRKLEEILPIESAEMWYWEWPTAPKCNNYERPMFHQGDDINNIPCWSLAALLNTLPKVINNETLFIETSTALWHIGYRNIYTARADNPVDACVEILLKLNELKLL